MTIFSQQQMHAARTTAAQTRRRIVDVLENSRARAAGFITALGRTLHYPSLR